MFIRFYMLVLLLPFVAHSAEVDNFNLPSKPLMDVTEELNKGIHSSLIYALASTNLNSSTPCDVDQLHFNMRFYFDTNSSQIPRNLKNDLLLQYRNKTNVNFNEIMNDENKMAERRKQTHPFINFLDKVFHAGLLDIINGNALEGRLQKEFEQHDALWPWYSNQLENENNIYHDFKDNYRMSLACCAATVNIGGTFVGLDKVGHFFENSYSLYNYEKEHGTEEMLQFNNDQEEGAHGLSFSKVKSYGDMTANFEGIKFWKWLYDGDNPAIQCKDGVFVLTKEFKIQEYVNAGWNESINCSDFTSQLGPSATQRILDATHGMGCPVEPKLCQELVRNYPLSVAEKILHPQCLKVGQELNQLSTPNDDCNTTLEGALPEYNMKNFIHSYSIIKMFLTNKKFLEYVKK